MSVIIRLQNLPWSANALDIRSFFRGLSIPDGGVHIVGGEMGDAFIAFSTDEDARQAMMQDRGKINEVQIRLLLSSRAEMQKVIETARQQSLAMQLQMTTPTLSATLAQKVALPTPQPPVITSNSLHNILSNQTTQLGTSFDSSRSYTSISQQQKSNYPASMESRSSRETSRDRRRSNSRERRRSRSPDHGGSRRRRDRSRSSDRKYRRSSRRSNSRDRSHERSHERSRERSHDRKKDKDRNESRRLHKKNKDSEMQDRMTDKRNTLEKSSEKDVAKTVPITNAWENQPTNAYTTSNFVATYAYQALQNVSSPGLNITGLNSSLANFAQNSTKSNFNSPSGNDSTESTINSSKSGLSSTKASQDSPSLNFFNAGQLENKPTFAFQNPYTQANLQSNVSSDSKQFSMMNLGKDRKTDDNSANQSNSYSTQRFSQFNQTGMSQNENNVKASNTGWSSASTNEPDAFGRNLPNKHDMSSKKDTDEEKSCIKITNMCPSTSYSDIRRFFSGLYIPNNGIKMINDQHGLRIGTAYIRFVRALNVPKALVRDGTQFKSRKISLEPVSDTEFDAAVDSFKPSRNQRFSNNDNGKPNYEPMRFSDNMRDDEPLKTNLKSKEKSPEKDFSILFVKDIPAYSTQQDIMKMFSSYTIVDILLTNRPDSRREIIAYVKFHRVEDAQAAYAEKSSHRINQRPVRVTISTEEEYERAKEELRITTERQLKEQQELEELEKRKQAEADAEAALAAAEIAQKEISHDVEENSMDCDPSLYEGAGQNIDFDQNEPIIDDFNSDQINLTKGQSNSSNPFGGIPSLLDIPAPVSLIEPTKNTDPRLRRNRPSRFDNPENDAMPQQANTNFIIVKNCEYKTSIQTVGEYFMSHDLMPIHVESLRNHRNQPCGEFIIEFRNNEDAEQAICLNNNRLNSRVIRISPISPQQIADRLNKPFMNCLPSAMSNANQGGMRSNFNNSPGSFNNNRSSNSSERNDFPFDLHTFNQPQTNPSRESNSGGNNKASSRGGGGGGSSGNQPNASNNRSRGRFGNNQQNFNPFKDLNNEDEFDSSPIKLEEETSESGIPEKFTRPGCVVEMENVPYRADLGDIIDFFDGYNVQAEDIIRRYNDDGTPTGDARVAFDSVAEAKAAFEAKRQKSIFNRTIFLNIL